MSPNIFPRCIGGQITIYSLTSLNFGVTVFLHDYRSRFNQTVPVSNSFFQLMKQTFGFYASICDDFLSNLGEHVENNTLDQYILNDLKPRLFESGYCQSIEEIKKKFLTENIKLEQFITENDFQENHLNDLNALKEVADAIYNLLQKHWELYKYENTAVNHKELITFIQDIDRVGIGWDAYLEKYLAVSNILTSMPEPQTTEGLKAIEVALHLPKGECFSVSVMTNLINFLQESYDFVLKIHDMDKNTPLEIKSFEAERPVTCTLVMPEEIAGTFEKFLNYLSVDVVKRETLFKFVVEIVRLQQKKEMTKQAIGTFQKKIVKQLDLLPKGSFLATNNNQSTDSVTLLSQLVKELETLKVQFKDLLTGSTNRLARNKVIVPGGSRGNNTKGESSVLQKKEGDPSTVRVDIKNKQHINFLTS